MGTQVAHQNGMTCRETMTGVKSSAVAVGSESMNFNGSGELWVTGGAEEGWVNTGFADFKYGVTYEAVITPNTNDPSGNIISNQHWGGAGFIFETDLLKWQVYIAGSGYAEINYSGTWVAGRKYHLVATYDGSTMNIYVNGSKVASKAQTGMIKYPDFSTVLCIGVNPKGENYEGGFLNNTYIHSARVYDRGLTAAEVSQNYTAETAVPTFEYPNAADIKVQDSGSGSKWFAVTTTTTAPSSVGSSNVTTGSTKNYWYQVANTTNEVETTFTGLTVGTYYAWGRDANGNAKCKKFTVVKGTPKITIPTNGSVVYNSTTTFAATSNAAGKFTVTSGNTTYVSITAGNGSSVSANGSVNVTYKGVKATIDAGVTNIPITIAFTPTDTTNWNTPSAVQYKVDMVNKANISPTVSMSGYTYAGTKSSPSISENSGSGTVTYYYNTSNSNSGGTAWSNVTSATSLNAGTYYMYAVVAETTNYYGATTATKSFTIARSKTATASASNKTYNGASQTGATGSNVSWRGTRSATNAGSYTAYATPTSNYAWSDGTYGQKTLSWHIWTKSVAVSWGSTTTFTYNGSAQAPTASASSGVSGETLNVTRSTQVNAGSYTSTATLSSVSGGQGKTSNYTLTGTTKAYVINRAKTATASAANKTYNGASQTGVSGSYVTWTGNTTGTNAGSYTAYATPTANYAWSDGTYAQKTVTWTMNPKSVAVSWGSTTTFTYNGSAQGPTASASSGVSGETLNISRTTGTNAGSYTSTAKLDSVSGGQARVANYTLTGTTKAFTINRATPTLTVNPASLTILKGHSATSTITYNGDGTLSVSSSSTGVEASRSNTTVTVKGKTAGSATITVSAAQGTNYLAKSATISVAVQTSNYSVSDVHYKTLAEAHAAISGTTGTIKVEATNTDSSTFTIGSTQSITLSLTSGTTVTKTSSTITNHGTLTITGTGTITTSAAMNLITNNGTLNITGACTLSQTASSGSRAAIIGRKFKYNSKCKSIK